MSRLPEFLKKRLEKASEQTTFKGDLERGQQQFGRLSPPITGHQKLPSGPTLPPTVFSPTWAVEAHQKRSSRQRPNLPALEIQGYMPPTNSDHVDSPRLVRDLLNKASSLPASATHENFKPEAHGFQIVRRERSNLPFPPANPSPPKHTFEREVAQSHGASIADLINGKYHYHQDSDLYADMVAYEQDEDDHAANEGIAHALGQGQVGYVDDPYPAPLRIHTLGTLAHDPSESGLAELAWSPRSSEDSKYHPSDLNVPAVSPTQEPLGLIDELENDVLHDHPGDSWSTSSGDTMELVDILDSISIDSPGSSSDFLEDSTPPFLDVAILAGNLDPNTHFQLLGSSQHEPSMGSRTTSSNNIVSRFSGIISDGNSQRSMSRREIEDSLQSLGVRSSSLSKSSSFGNQPGLRGSDGRNFAKAPYSAEKKGTLKIGGPGSSQTSSSLSRGGLSGDAANNTSGNAIDRTNPPTIRSPTPNLLFGRRALTKADDDWETVSDLRGTETRGSEAQTGSSLADNSDVSQSSRSKHPEAHLHNTTSREDPQHATQPRPNKAFVLIKDSQTGQIDCVPQSQFEQHGRALNLNPGSLASASNTNTQYHHPAPLFIAHSHPLRSPRPTLRSRHNMTASIEDGRSPSPQIVAVTQTLRSESSTNAVMAANDGDEGVGKTGIQGGRGAYESMEVGQHGQGCDIRTRSIHSSAWLSTVSEGESGKYSLPDGESSFAKVTVLGGKGNITGTPEGTGAREVGSSLADGSSQGAKFSSPAPFGSSPFSPPQQSNTNTPTFQQFRNDSSAFDTPFSTTAKQAHNQGSPYDNAIYPTPQYAHSYQSASGNHFDTPQASTSSLTGAGGMRFHDPSTDAASFEMYQRGYHKARKVHGQRKASPRLRRSSSESEGRINTSPSAQKASGLPSPIVKGHRHRNTSTGLLLRETFTRESDTSRHKSRDGAVNTGTAFPSFDHPVYGVRPWDEALSAPIRPSPRPSAYTRPVARAESPHLYRLPREPTPETIARQEQISFWVLVPTCVIPPLALLYGHGLLDVIISHVTSGEIKEFDSWHKMFAITWGYGVTGITILAIVAAMLILSS